MFSLQLSNLGFSPLLPSIQADVGMSFTQLGFFTGIYGLLALLLSVPAGLTAKRFGERRVLAAGLVGVAIGSLLLARAWSFDSRVPRPDDLWLSVRVRQRAHRRRADCTARASRPNHGGARRDLRDGLGRRGAARRRAGR